MERAKSRLRDARGGDVEVSKTVMHALNEPPIIIRHPKDVTVEVGGTAQFEVELKVKSVQRTGWDESRNEVTRRRKPPD